MLRMNIGNDFRHSKRQNSRLFLRKNNIFPITIKPSIKTELIRTALKKVLDMKRAGVKIKIRIDV
jgi:hypothetical protein